MPVIAPAVLAALAAVEAENAFNDAADQLFTGGPDYLANGSPSSLTASIGQAVGRAACRRYAENGSSMSAAKQARYEKACRPYLGGAGYNQPLGLLQPIRGGQCNALMYNFQLSYKAGSGAQQGSPPLRGYGPINVRAVANAFDVAGRPTSYSLDIFSRGFWLIGASPSPLLAAAWRTYQPSNTVTAGSSFTAQIINLATTDGVPDNCGSPPPVVREPGFKIDPQPPTFRFNPNADLDIDINVTTNIDGTITFNIGTGPITIDPFPPGSGEGGPGGGGGDTGGGGPAPGDDGQPAGGQPAAPGQDAQGEAPEGSVLVGLKMNMTTIPPGANQYMPGAYRGAAYIYMGGNGGLDQDFAGSILANGQFVYAEKDNLTKWKVRANNGFTFDVVPYYREV